MIKKTFLLILIFFCFLDLSNFRTVFAEECNLVLDNEGNFAQICENNKKTIQDEFNNSNNQPSQKTSSNNQSKGYQPLTKDPALAGLIENSANGNGTDLQAFLLQIYKWGLSLAALLAVIYIILGGVQYMTTDSIFNKGEGLKKIQSAIIGLLIVLAGFLILYEINPKILTSNNLGLGSQKGK